VTAPPFASCRAGGLWPEFGSPFDLFWRS